jgi:hypothetical protein
MAFFFKYIPETLCPEFGKKNNKNKDSSHEERAASLSKKGSIVSILRRGSSINKPVHSKDYHLEKKGSRQQQSS